MEGGNNDRGYSRTKCRVLTKDVQSLVRSGITINNVAQCVEELVLNSIDAKASNVYVGVSLETFTVKVEDNGDGLTKEDLEVIGKRYTTSKCNSLPDLHALRSYGFRGEALASIIDISTSVEIISKSRSRLSDDHGYIRKFKNGVSQSIKKAADSKRQSHGTTITVENLLARFPVRQKRVDRAIQLEEIKHCLEHIALINSHVSFDFKNNSNGKLILHVRSVSTLGESFKQLFCWKSGMSKHQNLIEENCQHDAFYFTGLISKDTHLNKNYQIVYINKRLVSRSKVHRALHHSLSQVIEKGCKNDNFQSFNKEKGGSPRTDKYPVFVINIKCPFDEYDITLDPKKNQVEFKKWDAIIKGCNGLAMSFRATLNAQNNLVGKVTYPSDSRHRLIDETSGLQRIRKDLGKEISTHDIKHAVHSRVAVREAIAHHPDNLVSSPQTQSSQHTKMSAARNTWDSGDKSRSSEENSGRKPSVSKTPVRLKLVSRKSTVINIRALKRRKKEDSSILGLKKPRVATRQPRLTATIFNKFAAWRNTKLPSVVDHSKPVKHQFPNKTNLSDQEIGSNWQNSQKWSDSRNKLNVFSTGAAREHNDSRSKTSSLIVVSPTTQKGVDKVKQWQRNCDYEVDVQTNSSCHHISSTSIEDNNEEQVSHSTLRSNNMRTRPNLDLLGYKVFGSYLKTIDNKLRSMDSAAVIRKELKEELECDETGRIILNKIQSIGDSQKRNIDITQFDCKQNDNELTRNKEVSTCRGGFPFPEGTETVCNYLTADNTEEPQGKCDYVVSKFPKETQEKCDYVVSKFAKETQEKCSYFQSNYREDIPSKYFFPLSNNPEKTQIKVSSSQANCSEESKQFVPNQQLIEDDDVTAINLTIGARSTNLGKNRPNLSHEFRPLQATGLPKLLSIGQKLSHSSICGDSLPFPTPDPYGIKEAIFPLMEQGCVNVPFPNSNHNWLPPLAEFAPSNQVKTTEWSDSQIWKAEEIDPESSQWSDWECDVVVDSHGQQWLKTEDQQSKTLYINLTTGESSYDMIKIIQTHRVPASEAAKLNKNFRYNWLRKYFPKGSTQFWKPEDSLNRIKPKGNIELIDNKSTTLSLGSNVQECIKGNLDELISSKWRDGYLHKMKIDEVAEAESNSRVRVSEYWDRPLGPTEIPVSNLMAPEVNFWNKKVGNTLTSFRFSKQDLSNVKVIAQMDNKFIVAKICNTSLYEKYTELLILFDQHAVHERIRLEQLVSESYCESSQGKKQIISVSIVPPIQLTFTDTEVRIMSSYMKDFESIGVKVEIINSTSVKIWSAPKVFATKIATEAVSTRDETVKRLIQSLLQEQVRHIIDTKGSSQAMPKTIFNILCSQACHGAIKFGDSLELAVCEELINKLKDCKAPFQCAHGRPVMVPLVDLQSVKTVAEASVLLPHQGKNETAVFNRVGDKALGQDNFKLSEYFDVATTFSDYLDPTISKYFEF